MIPPTKSLTSQPHSPLKHLTTITMIEKLDRIYDYSKEMLWICQETFDLMQYISATHRIAS